MEKKYRTEKENGSNKLRIIALKDFSDVKKGDRGGLIDKEENLSQYGDCWVYVGAYVSDNARVFGEARVYGNARVCDYTKVYGEAKIYGNAWVYGHAQIYGKAEVYGDVEVYGHAQVYGEAKVCGNAWVYGKARVYENAWVDEYIRVHDNAEIYGNVKLRSTNRYYITTSIKDSKDYVILAIKREFRIISFSNNIAEKAFIFKESYIKNIQTIRQLYEKEV